MKKINTLLWTLLYLTAIFSCDGMSEPALSTFAANIATPKKYLTDADRIFMLEHSEITFAYIPDSIKNAIESLRSQYPELDKRIDLTLFLKEAQHIHSLELLSVTITALINLLEQSALKTIDPENKTINILQTYLDKLITHIIHR